MNHIDSLWQALKRSKSSRETGELLDMHWSWLLSLRSHLKVSKWSWKTVEFRQFKKASSVYLSLISRVPCQTAWHPSRNSPQAASTYLGRCYSRSTRVRQRRPDHHHVPRVRRHRTRPSSPSWQGGSFGLAKLRHPSAWYWRQPLRCCWLWELGSRP